jgi:hypothetical protein
LLLCLGCAHAASPIKVSLRKLPLVPDVHRAHHKDKSNLVTVMGGSGADNDAQPVPITNFMDAQVSCCLCMVAGSWLSTPATLSGAVGGI